MNLQRRVKDISPVQRDLLFVSSVLDGEFRIYLAFVHSPYEKSETSAIVICNFHSREEKVKIRLGEVLSRV